MSNTIISLLWDFWLTKKQSEIFVYLYKNGSKPASTVASWVWWERTNIYKSLQKMETYWLISEVTKSWVKYFFIRDKKIFENKLQQEKLELHKKENSLVYLQAELSKLDTESYGSKPNISFYEWVDSIEQIFKNIYNEIQQNNFLQIKMFASNTLESRSENNFNTFIWDFVKKLDKKNINIEAYLWNGIMLFESIVKTFDTKLLEKLPAWNSAINTFVFWKFVYIVIFKEIPFGIKIESEEFSQMMHFLLKKSHS